MHETPSLISQADGALQEMIENRQVESWRGLIFAPQWRQRRFRENHFTYHGYQADVMFAWERGALPQAENARALLDSVRLTILRTSVNDIRPLARHDHPQLIRRAVELGLWEAERAAPHLSQGDDKSKISTQELLGMALKDQEMPQLLSYLADPAAPTNPAEDWFHAGVLRALTPHLDGETLHKGLAKARQIRDPWAREEAFSLLVPHFLEQIIAEALAAARVITNENTRAHAIGGLIPYLDEERRHALLDDSVAMVLALEDEPIKVGALSGLAPHLSGDLLDAVLADIAHLKNQRYYAQVLAALAANISPTLIQEALDVTQQIKSARFRADILVTLLPHLQTPQQERVLAECIAITRDIRSPRFRTEGLLTLLPYIPTDEHETMLTECVDAAEMIGDDQNRAETLAQIAPYLSGELAQRAIAIAEGIERDLFRMSALTAFIPQLTGEAQAVLLQQMYAATHSLKNARSRAEMLATVVPHLVGEQRKAGIHAGLMAVRAIRDARTQILAFKNLAPLFTEDLMLEALSEARRFHEPYMRAEAFTALLPHVQRQLLEEWLQAALRIKQPSPHTQALTRLSPHLTRDVLAKALARHIPDDRVQVKAFLALAPHVPEPIRERLLNGAVRAARNIEDGWFRVQAFEQLASQLHGERQAMAIREGLALAVMLEEPCASAEALLMFLPYVREKERDDVIESTLACLCNEDWRRRAAAIESLSDYLTETYWEATLHAAMDIEDMAYRTKAFKKLATVVRGDVLGQLLQEAQRLRHEEYRLEVLRAALPHLPEAEQRRTVTHSLDTALQVTDPWARIVALGALLPYIQDAAHAPTLTEQTLHDATTIEDTWSHVHALVVLLPQLKNHHFSQAIEQALRLTRSLTESGTCMSALTLLAPYLKNSTLSEAIQIAAALPNERFKAAALGAFAPYLKDEHAPLAIEAACTIHDEVALAYVLVTLAPHLKANHREAIRLGMQSAHSIQDHWFRALALKAFTNALPDHNRTHVFADVRRALADHFYSFRDQSREEVLWAIAEEDLFAPPIFPVADLTDFAAWLVEVCQDWIWD